MGGMLGTMRNMYRSVGPECTEWWLALVRAVPGRIGRVLRSRVYRKRLPACGETPVFQQYVVLLHPELISMGDRVAVSPWVMMEGAGDIRIGHGVMIGPGVMIWSINHDTSDVKKPLRDQGYIKQPVVIEDDVWLGAGTIILPGARIGQGSIIAAGSVVRGVIPSGVVAAGVPAVVKRQRGTRDDRSETP
jgi:acetyltransferase-like isoleucine patch superfamily enzyme